MLLRTIIPAGFLLCSRALSQNAPIAIQVTPNAGVTTSIGPPPAPVRQEAQPAIQGPPAKVEGRVANASTGEPLKRAGVWLMPAEPRPDSTPYSTMTDATGRFAMAEIPPGKYRLWAQRTGYVRQENGARGQSQVGTTITVAPGQELKQIEFRLQPHAVITGRVTDEEGEPVAHVQVQTMTYRYMQGKRQLVPAGGASTNDLGEYRIFGLAGGRYYLSGNTGNGAMMWNSVDRTAGARANQPDEGYALTYYPGTNDTRAAVQVHVTPGKPLTNVDIRLLRTRTVRIRGRITNAGTNSMQRPMIMLTPRDGGFMMFGRNMSTTQGPDGKFELRGVTPGAYYLVAQLFDANERQFARVPVDVGSTDLDGIEIAVSAGQELKGTIRIEGDPQANTSAVRLFLEPKEFSPMGGGGAGMVKDDGTFSIRNVAADTYRLRVMGSQNQFYVKSVYVGQQEAKDGEFTVIANAAPALSVVVSTAGGQVTGRVKGEKDTPTQGAMVVLVPDTAKRQRQDLYKFAASDQYGSFTLSAIAPGEYKLFAWDNVDSGQWMDPDFLQVYENKGKSISIRENAKETADLDLLKNASAGEGASAQ